MNRLALLLPLLALAAASARAEDPATNAPAEPAPFHAEAAESESLAESAETAEK